MKKENIVTSIFIYEDYLLICDYVSNLISHLDKQIKMECLFLITK